MRNNAIDILSSLKYIYFQEIILKQLPLAKQKSINNIVTIQYSHYRLAKTPHNLQNLKIPIRVQRKSEEAVGEMIKSKLAPWHNESSR